MDPAQLDALVRRADQLAGPDPAAPAPPQRQPVHTVYVPADRFAAHTVGDWGAAALRSLDDFGPLPDVSEPTRAWVRAKLATDPVEDLRIDLEDGYGNRRDEQEDADAVAAGRSVRAAADDGRWTPFAWGVRIRSFEQATRARGIRSLLLLIDAASPLPPGFRVTLPKVTSVAQVRALADLADQLGFAFEIQVETPHAVLGPDGHALVAPMIGAARGRCVGLHYGTYDYSAALGIAAEYQSMEHPAADHAKAVMQVAAAAAGVPVCDGSTNVLPVGSREQVHAAWALHARLVRRSMQRGFYQGWDLHPAQLPTRFAAVHDFFTAAVPAAAARLRDYLDRTGSGILDEPATARALAGQLARALDAGVLDAAGLADRTGLTVGQLARLRVHGS